MAGLGSEEDGSSSRSKCSFLEWMDLQERDLSELVEALAATPRSDERLAALADKAVSHFEDYVSRRSQLSRADAASFYAPTWCTPWENSLLWIAGCRPSSYFRVVYGLGTADLEPRLSAFLSGGLPASELGELSARQLRLVDELHRRTVRAEDRLSTRLAGLQEDVADRPVAAMAKESERVGEMSGDVEAALEAHERSMAAALEEADALRVATVKHILGILSPAQAVDFLAMSKKLHLCIHKWSNFRDHLRSHHPPPPT